MKIIKSIQNRIYEIRGERVILDRDLADLYEVETKVLNQSFKRIIKRFPKDFMFQLTVEEWQMIKQEEVYLRSQFVTSKLTAPVTFLTLLQNKVWRCLVAS